MHRRFPLRRSRLPCWISDVVGPRHLEFPTEPSLPRFVPQEGASGASPIRMFESFKKVGPGLIVAAASIGAGETVLAVRAGAWGGYRLLWLILVAVVSKNLLTLYLLGRYSVITGKEATVGLVELPGPRGWLLWVILVIEIMVGPLVFVAIAVPCGRLLNEVLMPSGSAASYKWFAVGFATVAIVVAMRQKYETLEKTQLVLCLILLFGTIIATALAAPDAVKILKGFVSFGRFPDYPSWVPSEIKQRSSVLEMATIFGYAGSICLNYVVYSNWVLLKGWQAPSESDPQKLSTALRPLRYDVAVNAALVLLVTAAFLIAGACILRPLERIPAGYDLLSQQAEIFSRISPALVPLYYLIIIVALWGTLNALPDIYARGAHSCIRQLVPGAKTLPLATVMRWFVCIMLPLIWVLVWTETRPIFMMDIVALFSTNLGVGLVCVGALWLDRQLPAERRAAAWVWWSTLVGAVVVNAAAAVSVWEKLGSYVRG